MKTETQTAEEKKEQEFNFRLILIMTGLLFVGMGFYMIGSWCVDNSNIWWCFSR